MNAMTVLQENRFRGLKKTADKVLEPIVQRIRLCLTDGQLDIDGQKVNVPVGIGRHLTGRGIKALCRKYKNLLLFVKNGKSWQRIGDRDVVEITDDPEFKTQRPVVRTAASYHRD